MPRYVYQCRECLEVIEEIRPMRKRHIKPDCPNGHGKMPRCIGLEQCNTDTKDFLHPILSERMGVMASQVDEHRKAFPNIPITDTGEIIVRNSAEERRINRELAKQFREY